MFSNEDSFTQPARRLSTLVQKLILPVVRSYLKQGYSPRDVAYVLNSAFSAEILLARLKYRSIRRRTKR